MKGVVSKETVVLRRWGSSKRFALTKGKRSKRQLLESLYGGQFTLIINSVDKSKLVLQYVYFALNCFELSSRFPTVLSFNEHLTHQQGGQYNMKTMLGALVQRILSIKSGI